MGLVQMCGVLSKESKSLAKSTWWLVPVQFFCCHLIGGWHALAGWPDATHMVYLAGGDAGRLQMFKAFVFVDGTRMMQGSLDGLFNAWTLHLVQAFEPGQAEQQKQQFQSGRRLSPMRQI